MNAVFYWDMTLKEILASIEGAQKRKREKLQFMALVAYGQAEQIASLVAKVFGSKHKAPTIYEVFPNIFPDLEKPRQQNWQIMKARIEAYAAERRKRGEKHGHDARRTSNSHHD